MTPSSITIPLLQIESGEQKMPVLSQTESKIYELVVPHLSLSTPHEKKIIHNPLALILKTTLGLGGILGRIPLIQLSLNFEKQIPGLGAVFAATNFVSYSAYLVWASSLMVNQIFTTFALHTAKVTQTSSLCKKATLLAFNICNGCIAQIPYLILSWDYNPTKPYLVGLNAMDVTLPIYSLQLMTSQKFLGFNLKPFEKKILTLQSILIKKLEWLITKHIETDSSPSIFNLDSKDKSMRCIHLLNVLNSLEFSEPSTGLNPFDKATLIASNICGFFLMSLQLAWLALLCNQGLSKVTDNKGLIGFFCVYVVICNWALTQMVLIASTHQVLKSSQSLLFKNTNTYLSQRLAPKAALICKIATVIICLTPFIPAAQMSIDYLPKEWIWPSTIGYGLGFALMDYLPMRELSEDIILLVLSNFGDDDKKHQILMSKNLQYITSIFKHADLVAISCFLLKFESHPFIKGLLEKNEISLNGLMDYAGYDKIRYVEVI
jgi:hypothetical protein